ncbi:hypothetical protein D3C72_890760 [compost metagenome]
MVRSVFTILKIIAWFPIKVRSVKSLAKSTNEVAPCSNDSQKKTVKKAKIITAIILSRTILV